MRKAFVAVVCAVSALVWAAPAGASSIVVGTFDADNCYPFSCLATDGGTTYQQVYAASEFSGIFTFDTVSFFRHPDYSGSMDTADYQISFSTTLAAVDGLDTTWANNIGADSAVFGNYTVSGVMPDVLSFGGTAFTYDPSAGNLLMTVQISNPTIFGRYSSFFQSDTTGTVTSRLFAFSSASGVASRSGLVTEFTAVPVPEPATLLLLGTGLGAVAARRRLKKRA